MEIMAMAEINVDVSKLPEDVREKLAELDLELSEGELKDSKRSLVWTWSYSRIT